MEYLVVRNNVPDGDHGELVPLAGVEKRAGGSTGRVLIEQLRASIRALEQVPVSLATPPAPGAAPSRPACSLLPPSNDNAESPLESLQQGGLHELKPERFSDTPAALGFALAVIAASAQTNCRGLVLWCLTRTQAREWGRPYGPALFRSGLDPARLLIVEARTADDAAWALEEGLKSGALLACLAQIPIKTPLAARRLGLAAQASRTPCLLLSDHGSPGLSVRLSLSWNRLAWNRSARDADPLAHRHGAEPPRPLRCGRARRRRLAPHAGAVPGTRAGIEFSRGVQS